jgi:predicted amidophosphoribosyltransferase
VELNREKMKKCCNKPSFDENGVCWNCDPEAKRIKEILKKCKRCGYLKGHAPKCKKVK